MAWSIVYISDTIAIMRGMQSGWYRKAGDWYEGPYDSQVAARIAQLVANGHHRHMRDIGGARCVALDHGPGACSSTYVPTPDMHGPTQPLA